MGNMTYAGGGGSVQFPFAAFFPRLIGTDGKSPDIDTACVTIETEWSGIFSLFSTFDTAIMVARQNLLEGYLVAWWLADMYPTKVRAAQGDGGMPLTSKSIGGVSITRKDMEFQPGLKMLESNVFGLKAAGLILAAPERMMLFGGGASPIAARAGWTW